MNVFFITDPLIIPIGSVRPPLLLAKELQKFGYNVTLISPSVSTEVVKLAKESAINVESLNVNFRFMPVPPIFEVWIRSLFKRETPLSLNDSDGSVLINTSSCIKVKSDICYAQGYMTIALGDMLSEMPVRYKCACYPIIPILKYLENASVKQVSRLSKLFIANSKFCASMYENRGINVSDVIPPPLDCRLFRPTTAKPSQDYVLTYFGFFSKETKFSVIKRIADAGLKIKAFGFKATHVPTGITKHPNVEFLGKVSDEELADLYSNALFTLFTFTHEPFGYVPVESMACGTPVLTYNKQGPSESVMGKSTGWLVDNDEELLNLALRLWRNGYPQNMREKCRRRSLLYDVENIFKRWNEVVNRFLK